MSLIAPILGASELQQRRLLLSADPDLAAVAAQAAYQLGWAGLETIAFDGKDAIAAIEAGAPPWLLIVDIDGTDDPLAAIDRLADVCLAGTQLVAIGSRDDARLFRALINAGAADYQVKPVDAQALVESLRLSAASAAAAGSNAAAVGQLVAVIGARGGCGATAIATSIAWMIASDDDKGAEKSRNSAILVDLDLHYGSAALALGVEPGTGLGEMLASPDRLDEQLIAACLRKVNDRLALVASELPIEQDAAIAPAATQALLTALCATAPFVIADMPRRLDPSTRQILRTADKVVLVLPPSLEGLRDAGRMLGYLSALRAGSPPLLVVNGGDGGIGDISRQLAEATLGRRLAAWIPVMAGPAAAAAAHGVPLAALAGGRAGNAFDGLTSQITGSKPAAQPRWPRWWPQR